MHTDRYVRADTPTDSLLELVLDTTQEAFVAIDEAGRVCEWNPAAEALFGWPRAEAIGRLLADTIVPPSLREAHQRGLASYLDSMEPRLVGQRVELPAVRRDGGELLVELSITPLRVDDGWRFAAFLRDAGVHARARVEAARGAERLEALEQVSRLGSWEWDLDTREMTWSHEQLRIFGIKPATRLALDTFLDRVHDDDRERVQAAMLAALADERPFDVEFRIVRPSGETRHLQGRGAVLRSADGRAVRLIGTNLDVTEREERHADARRKAAVFASTRDAVLTTDRSGRITSWNAGAEELYGYSRSDVLGRSLAMLIPPDLAGEDRLTLDAALSGEGREHYATRRRAKDGRLLDVSLTVSPVFDERGHIVEVSEIARDIGEAKRAERELRRYADDLEALARRDALTGLLNKRELHGLLDRELSKEGEPCALVLVDVDDLGVVNERHGRDAGDALLRDLASVVSRCAAEHEVCRAGGDEICVVLPGTGSASALALGERIRRAWEETRPEAGLSFGCASFPDEANAKPDLLARVVESLQTDRPREVERRDGVTRRLARSGEDEAAARIVALLRRHLGMEVAYLSEFVAGRQIVRVVDHGQEHPDIRRGTDVDLDASYCRLMIDADLPNVVPDTRSDSRTASHPATVTGDIGSYVGVPVRLSDGTLYGSLCCASRRPSASLDETAAHFAHVCARFVGDLLEQRLLEAENRRLHGELVGVRALLAALDARDHYTGEHSEAVVALACAVARRLGLAPEAVAEIEQVALLHDIGKIGISDTILQKPGPLDQDEWRLMREHPAIGARIVATIPSLAHLAPAIRGEHERWDGSGYPDGLSGDTIPFASRIILACDAWHAMTSDRPYRAAMARADALAELAANAGTQFDPSVVAALAAELEAQGAEEQAAGP